MMKMKAALNGKMNNSKERSPSLMNHRAAL